MKLSRAHSSTSGFTLIELLVVVAVIAILAGIALPNFLEAQTRAKVARAKSDMRTLSVALESYQGDNNKYPSSTLVPMFARLIPLTTPVSYLSSIPLDVFNTIDGGAGPFRSRGNFAYGARPIDREARYAIASEGPDRHSDHSGIELYPGYPQVKWETPGASPGDPEYYRYDPTNGTISRGDIWRVSDFNFQ